jgi:uncharacterized protein
MAAATPMFITDAALGRLATWLRLLGFDTVYGRDLDAAALARTARRTQRLLLTRNTRLARRRDAPPLLLIRDDDFRRQLRQVWVACDLQQTAGFLRRCAVCNLALAPVPAAAAAALVPPYVAATQADFARCPSCRRVYWPATHVAHMHRELAAALGADCGQASF